MDQFEMSGFLGQIFKHFPTSNPAEICYALLLAMKNPNLNIIITKNR